MARLGDIGKIITGNTPKTSEIENYSSNDICFVKPSDILESDITYVKDSEFYISELARDKARILPPQSILVTCIGIIGKVAINQVECAFNQQINAIIPNLNTCVPNYLAYAIQYKKNEIQGIANAAVVPILNKTQFSDIEVNLPQLDEQLKIAAVLDKLTSTISLRKQQLAKLDELVKVRFVEMFGDLTINSKGLKIVHLSEVAEYFNGLTYKPENVSDIGTIVLRSSNIQDNQLDFADTVRVNCQIKERLFVRENDILMCSRNGSARLVGKVALIPELNEPMSFGAFMMIIRSKYYPYLVTYFQDEDFRRQIKTGATTTINQITGRMLDEVVLPVPELKNMAAFESFTEKIFAEKLTIQQSLDKLEVLRKSLMQEYFG